MASQPRTYLTPEEYLEIERNSRIKHQYFAGEIFAMTGGTARHSLIAMNTGADLRQQLRERDCTVYSSDMRVKVEAAGLYTYPDVVVVCGEPEFEDDRRDTLLNPTLLVEVLSESTEAYDRGAKFGHYRKIPSLKDYLLISQTEPLVERFSRREEGDWLLSYASQREAAIDLPSIDCRLSLAEAYLKVEFETSSS